MVAIERRRLFIKLAALGTCVVLLTAAIAQPYPGFRKILFVTVPDVVWAAVPPVINITSPAAEQQIGQTTVVISGTTEPGASVDVFIDGAASGNATADGSGSWLLSVGPLGEGLHSVYAVTTDTSLNTATSETVNFAVDITPPAVSITSPLNGSYLSNPVIEGSTEPNLPVTVYVYGRSAVVAADHSGYWFYADPTLPEGNHTVYATATDLAGNTGTSETSSFTLDMTRPVVLTSLLPPDDMTRVPLDTAARVYLADKSPLDQAMLGTAIFIAKKASAVEGSVYEAVYGTVYSAVYADVYGEPYYEILFKPNEPLLPATKYTVSVNPLLADAAGNYVYARSWSFTTVGSPVVENPHGNYIANVNVCVNCHTPHRAGDPKLVEPRDTQYGRIDDYCNACHDGTVAPVPDNWLNAYQHNFRITMEGTVGPSGCTSCHNPHVTWSPETPNLLQDYYYFTHNDPTNPYLPNSSEQEMCELCHDMGITYDSRVQYVRYQYNKWHTTLGTTEDYSLCLRCHDGNNASDIASFYQGSSMHAVSAQDGSALNGHFACADCHNTHGSVNLKMLKEDSGHNNTQPFRSQGSVWDSDNERRYCLSCHNNFSETYGIVAEFVYDIPGHEITSTEFCHNCHGGTAAKAAHAPTLPN